jgi:hypothetical protein
MDCTFELTSSNLNYTNIVNIIVVKSYRAVHTVSYLMHSTTNYWKKNYPLDRH